MTDRILDFSQQSVQLRCQLKQLVVKPECGITTTIPLEDTAVVLVSHPQITFSQAVFEGFAENGCVLIACK